MQTYLEVKLPINKRAGWIANLKNQLKHVPVRWQDGFYHITLAFLNDTPENLEVSSIIDRHMENAVIQSLYFDKLDVFTTTTANMHIINLTVTNIPDSFMKWVNDIRTDLVESGCTMQSGFRLHVTLGRVDASTTDLDTLQKTIETVHMPSFHLPIISFDYKEFRGRTIKEWNL